MGNQISLLATSSSTTMLRLKVEQHRWAYPSSLELKILFLSTYAFSLPQLATEVFVILYLIHHRKPPKANRNNPPPEKRLVEEIESEVQTSAVAPDNEAEASWRNRPFNWRAWISSYVKGFEPWQIVLGSLGFAHVMSKLSLVLGLHAPHSSMFTGTNRASVT